VSFSNSITFCGRFNYQVLSYDSKFIWVRGAPEMLTGYGYFSFWPDYPLSFFGFGNQEKGVGYYSNWLLKETSGHAFRVWAANRWHHACFTYDHKNSHISFVKVKS
jgi:hypothetical protein